MTWFKKVKVSGELGQLQAGQLFPTVVRFESAHDCLERYTMKGVTRLFGASSRVIHAYLAPSSAQSSIAG